MGKNREREIIELGGDPYAKSEKEQIHDAFKRKLARGELPEDMAIVLALLEQKKATSRNENND